MVVNIETVSLKTVVYLKNLETSSVFTVVPDFRPSMFLVVNEEIIKESIEACSRNGAIHSVEPIHNWSYMLHSVQSGLLDPEYCYRIEFCNTDTGADINEYCKLITNAVGGSIYGSTIPPHVQYMCDSGVRYYSFCIYERDGCISSIENRENDIMDRLSCGVMFKLANNVVFMKKTGDKFVFDASAVLDVILVLDSSLYETARIHNRGAVVVAINDLCDFYNMDLTPHPAYQLLLNANINERFLFSKSMGDGSTKSPINYSNMIIGNSLFELAIASLVMAPFEVIKGSIYKVNVCKGMIYERLMNMSKNGFVTYLLSTEPNSVKTTTGVRYKAGYVEDNENLKSVYINESSQHKYIGETMLCAPGCLYVDYASCYPNVVISHGIDFTSIYHNTSQLSISFNDEDNNCYMTTETDGKLETDMIEYEGENFRVFNVEVGSGSSYAVVTKNPDIERTILPFILDMLIKKRSLLQSNTSGNSFKSSLSRAVKLISNSIISIVSTDVSGCFNQPMIAALVTHITRSTIVSTKNFFMDTNRYTFINAHTDGIKFALMDGVSKSDVEKDVSSVNEQVNNNIGWHGIKMCTGGDMDFCMNLKIENIFRSGYIMLHSGVQEIFFDALGGGVLHSKGDKFGIGQNKKQPKIISMACREYCNIINKDSTCTRPLASLFDKVLISLTKAKPSKEYPHLYCWWYEIPRRKKDLSNKKIGELESKCDNIRSIPPHLSVALFNFESVDKNLTEVSYTEACLGCDAYISIDQIEYTNAKFSHQYMHMMKHYYNTSIQLNE